MRRVAVAAAWLGLIGIAFSTLSPIGLRPHLGGPNYERLFAFALIGALFGLAYPKHLLRIAIIVVGFAVGLEILQMIIPGRHARMFDAVVKACGGMAGVFVAAILNSLLRRF
ncbi:VanZ family protein [Tianweitania sp. BSSL-BM11]|uniref:VanZ family protein n=1 Tax=Tianweitania aestuarii TaxID=2814886 RepID=A0ABS5RRV9_9HYPH|nr:VanZ family protein [Tianweitania aestuarii]MBS9719790.1 VanZ family protein [Tianweitania aestuarii]